jgi:hypothetical protein
MFRIEQFSPESRCLAMYAKQTSQASAYLAGIIDLRIVRNCFLLELLSRSEFREICERFAVFT